MVSNHTVETEHFLYGHTSDVPKTKRNIQSEIKGENLDVQREVDAFELSRGIVRKPKLNISEYIFNNIVLDPEEQKDNDMLTALLNSDKYLISYYKDNWTAQGTYRVFIIYGTKKENK
jgi:hypothetical protein